jgi:catechol 2,3-dioxygenase-like lactoylglutathione lyase family enzyme
LARAHARVLALGRRADPFRALLIIEVTTMLADSLAVTTLVVTDLDRSKKFYAEQLGLKLLEETPFTCRFGAGKGSQLSIRRGQPPVSGPTVAHFEVDDIEAQVRDLTSRGVTFDEYETPKTVNFIAQVGPARGAWFKDPDGNVIGVREGPVPAAG